MAKLSEKGIIDIYRGDTSDLVLTWFDEDEGGTSTPIDLTQYDRIDFQIRTHPDEEALVDRSTGDATIEISGDDNNILTIKLPPIITKDFPPSREGHYSDIQFTEVGGGVISYPGNNRYWRVPVIPDVTKLS